jgi:hypothetical protein
VRGKRIETFVFFCGFALFSAINSAGQEAPKASAADSKNSPVVGGTTQTTPLPDGNAAVNDMNVKYIQVWRTLMAPKNVADAFGPRIAKRYIAIQITVANRNTEYQWLIESASVTLDKLVLDLDARVTAQPNSACSENLTRLLNALKALGAYVPPAPTEEERAAARTTGTTKLPSAVATIGGPATVSSADLTVLRGVAEKGAALDSRNFTLRILTGAGTIAAGLLGITRFGDAFAPSIAAFNGPLLTAYQTTFPDFTVNQLNRLNDSAFTANTIVGKQQAKVIVIFIPADYLLTKDEASRFYHDPNSVFGCPDLRLLEASVNGNFVETVLPTPVITAITVNANEEANFGKDDFSVGGIVTGHFLDKAKIALSNPPDGVTISANPSPTESQLPFTLKGKKPLMPGQALDFELTVAGTQPAKSTFKVNYSPAKPTLKAGALAPGTLAPGGAAQKVTVKGANFLPEGMQVLVEPSTGIKVGPIQYISDGEVQVELTVADTAAEGQREFRISSAGGLSDPATTLTIKK